MEAKFKTSFIPKQSLQQPEEARFVPKKTGAPIGLATMITFLMLAVALGASGILYFYKQHLTSAIQEKQKIIQDQSQAFEPALVNEYTRTAARIEAARAILDQHNAMTFAFSLLEQITLKKVQYDTMTLVYNGEGSSLDLNLTGNARSYKVLALQSDVYGSNQFVREPTVSGLKALDNGTVGFTLTTRLDARLVSYKLGVEQGAYESPQETAPIPAAPVNNGSTL
jgi:hypothetical protein